jgi:hypothetical protein
MRKFVTTSALVLLMGAIPAFAQTAPSEEKRAPQSQQNPTQQNPTQQNPQQNPSTQATPADQRSKSQDNQSKTEKAPNNATTQSQEPTRKDNTQTQRPTDKNTPSGAKSNNEQAGDNKNNKNKSDMNADEQKTKASVNLSDQQRTQISAAISSQRVQPLTNVNFSISVGTTIPRSVRLHTLPSNIVAIVPQYRGYSYIVVREEIIIVEPRTYRIVAVLPYRGGQAATTTNRSVKFTSEQRHRIRTAAQRRQVVRSQFRVGQIVPTSVELHEFPDTLYTEIPDAREYRYVTGSRGIVVIEPQGRRVIDVIE